MPECFHQKHIRSILRNLPISTADAVETIYTAENVMINYSIEL